MKAIVPVPTAQSSLPATLVPDLDRALELALEEKAAATRRAYGSDFQIFEAWCQGRGVSALPATPEAVAAFLAHSAPRPAAGRRACRAKTAQIFGHGNVEWLAGKRPIRAEIAQILRRSAASRVQQKMFSSGKPVGRCRH